MDRTADDILTRRSVIASGGALIGAGVLAGCAGKSTPSDGSDTGTADGNSYSVSMAPMDEVSFESVPERTFVIFPQYADMAVALGHADTMNSVYVPEMCGPTMNHYYHHLAGVSFDWKGLRDPLSDGLGKELLYELNSDVHFADPAYISTQDKWDKTDIDDINSGIGPWFGNFYSGTHDAPPDPYRDRYQYYTLWELFGKVSRVFREEKRYRALNGIHTKLVTTIQERLPPKSERPTVVRVTMAKNKDVFYTYHLNKPGYWLADTRPLGANDGFANQEWSSMWGTVNYEAMLEADPDIILHLWGLTPNREMKQVRERLATHPLGKQLQAVQNERVYPGGIRYQGPIMNLFQLEMGAKQLYPDVFGEWPEYVDGEPYPTIPENEQLFDRQRVADIVNGND